MKTAFQICLIGLFFFILLPLTSAKDLTFILDQKEYYFKVGSSAIIPLQIFNSYGKQIEGQFTYSYTQAINQGGLSFSNSNTQSKPFSVSSGNSNVSLDFGSSSSPGDLKMSMSFSFNDGDAKEARLEEVIIHFVDEDSQVKNEQNQVKSKSGKVSQSQQSGSQSTFSQMQKKMEEMFGNSPQEQQGQESTQQKLQNNQMGQDSSALKNQMQKEMQEEEQMKQEFQNAIAQNQQFQEEHQSLIQQGYNLTSGNINPTTKNSGSFDLQYQKPNGETAELKGSMENGEMQNLQKLTSEEQQRLLKELEENFDFLKFNKQLGEEGFNRENAEFFLNENKTDIKVNYKHSENKTSRITAQVINGDIQDVILEDNKENSDPHFLFWIAFFLILTGIIAYFIFKKTNKKEIKIIEKQKAIETPFDYLFEARKLIDEGKELFNEEKFKDAYSRINQAVRLYLSYKNGIKKEMTNDDVIAYFKKQKEELKGLKEFFDLCSMVEFAKYQANKKDFDWITEYAEKLIK